QRGAAAARAGDRSSGTAVAGRGGEVRRPQPRPARGRAGVGVLGYAAAKGRGHVGRRWTAANEGARQDRTAANRRPDAGAGGAATGGSRREQDPHKKPAVRSIALTFR